MTTRLTAGLPTYYGEIFGLAVRAIGFNTFELTRRYFVARQLKDIDGS